MKSTNCMTFKWFISATSMVQSQTLFGLLEEACLSLMCGFWLITGKLEKGCMIKTQWIRKYDSYIDKHYVFAFTPISSAIYRVFAFTV